MEKRLRGGLADSASSRLVEQANIRAGLQRRYLLFGTISTFQAARVDVYLHIDVGVCVRPTFQHSGAALSAAPVGGVLGGAAVSLVFCWAVLPGLLWVLLRLSSSFQWCCLPPPPLGGFSLLFCWVVLLGFLLPFGSVAVFPSPVWSHDGLGCWGVGRLVGCWSVEWFGDSVLRAGSCVGWLDLALVLGCWVAKRMGVLGVFSVWIGVGVFLKACFLVWARITMKSDQHCELCDSVNHLKVERILLFALFF